MHATRPEIVQRPRGIRAQWGDPCPYSDRFDCDFDWDIFCTKHDLGPGTKGHFKCGSLVVPSPSPKTILRTGDVPSQIIPYAPPKPAPDVTLAASCGRRGPALACKLATRFGKTPRVDRRNLLRSAARQRRQLMRIHRQRSYIPRRTELNQVSSSIPLSAIGM